MDDDKSLKLTKDYYIIRYKIYFYEKRRLRII